MTLDFEEFCNRWINLYLELRDKGASTREIGARFEEHFRENVLLQFVPGGYRIARNPKRRGIEISGNGYEFDFLIVKRGAVEFDGVVPSDVLAAFEVRSHGFYDDAKKKRMEYALKDIEKKFPHIKLFYVTFRENASHEENLKEIFGNLVRYYYRLSDSGDGVQIPPKRYLPNEWKRLIEDLSKLSNST